VRDELVWIDCEMTGLDTGSDRLIEIAALVTDGELNILGEGVDVVIHADDAALDGMAQVVAQMHSKSGLTEEVRASTVDLAEAEGLVLDYIRKSNNRTRRRWRAIRSAPTADSSPATCLRWTITCTTA
jgi:oligoribonuclease